MTTFLENADPSRSTLAGLDLEGTLVPIKYLTKEPRGMYRLEHSLRACLVPYDRPPAMLEDRQDIPREPPLLAGGWEFVEHTCAELGLDPERRPCFLREPAADGD